MPAFLSVKLEAKRRICAAHSSRETTLYRAAERLSCWEQARYRTKRLSRTVADHLRRTFSFWSRGDIKSIEGLYGSGVGTYFVFLRFLVVLNLWTAALRWG